MKTWHHWAFAVIVGFLLGYYFSGIGDKTVGRIVPRSGGAY